MLEWKKLSTTEDFNTFRAEVPGGWLVLADYGRISGLTFYPDPDHQWDGSSQ